jgi:hypothetical protein
LTWIKHVLTQQPDFLDRYLPTHSVADFKERLARAVSETDPAGAEVRGIVIELGSLLGIEPEAPRES